MATVTFSGSPLWYIVMPLIAQPSSSFCTIA